MRQQIIVMLELQESMNTRVHPQWREQGYAWHRAIWVECAELLDHYGWKWWKRQAPDIEQVTLELIDIWHFGLSALLQDGQPLERIAERVAQSLGGVTGETDFREDLETLVMETLQCRHFNVGLFARLMAGIGLAFDDLYTSYVGKNVLNFFRQDHGYKEGTYRKQWGGREDNEHLVEIVRDLDSGTPGFKDELYAALKLRYTELAN